jgi:glycoside/pentoside/hexuronide:cation symporter, GPH family
MSQRPAVPISTRIFYGIGSVSEGVKDTAFNVFLLFYYNNVLGLSGTLVGLAIFIALCVDAITDPLMGVISDNTRTRLGRRHPYMYFAALPVALSFALLFMPPAGLQDMALFGWLLGFAILLRVSLTFYAVPSNAMAAELSSDYDERTEIISIRFFFGWMAGLGAAIAGYLLYFNTRPDGSDGRLLPQSYADFGLVCALLAGTAILICALGTQRAARMNPNRPDPRSHLWDDMRTVLRNPSFRALVVSAIFSAGAWGYINAVGYYVNTYFWGLTGDQLGILTLGMVLSVIVAAIGAPILGSTWDKKSTALRLAAFAIVFGPAPIVLRLMGWFPENGTRDLMVLLFFHVVILVTALIAINILTASMVADLTDEGEQASGRRLEGAFTSIIVFMIKASSGIGALLAGVMLDLIRFPRQQQIADVPPETVQTLGSVYAPAVMLLYIVSLYFLSRYRLRRADHSRILQELAEARRARDAA